MKLLETRDLTISFGGHTAVHEVNFTLEEDHFKSIIGPNGAGKTTFFNLISGQLKPTKGSVYFEGREITSLPPHARTQMGMGRSFQIANIFPNLTVHENLRLAVQTRGKASHHVLRHHLSFKEMNRKTEEIMEKAKLTSKAYDLAKHLPHGDKRKLEIGMLLALDSKLLLLDEPTAGMSLEEVPSILEVIRSLRDERKRAILLIEHKVDMVLDLSDSVAVLHHGRLIADGSPKEIMENEVVQSAYLGGLYHGEVSSQYPS
ncbi:ABC transporter ATP-binding protein [Thermicanus aegyptius]|uniref:ABC transporter ATP-binding protein n=1 Tax=Thermicanus aegyptius TaxID=94009 RepID=UPI0004203BDF|nr:ABC transporter ATP-binding protein [Thermicanus aegyptius]